MFGFLNFHGVRMVSILLLVNVLHNLRMHNLYNRKNKEKFTGIDIPSPDDILSKVREPVKAMVDEMEINVLSKVQNFVTNEVLGNIKNVVTEIVGPVFKKIIDIIADVVSKIFGGAFTVLIEPLFKLTSAIIQKIFGIVTEIFPSISWIPLLVIGALLTPFMLVILLASIVLSIFFGPWVMLAPIVLAFVLPVIGYYYAKNVANKLLNVDYKEKIIQIINDSPDLMEDIVKIVQKIVADVFKNVSL